MQKIRPLRKPLVAAALSALAAGALLAAPPQSSIVGGGQEVRVLLSESGGSSTTVCLETAPSVSGRKRAVVWYGESMVSVSTGQDDRGPSCATFVAPGAAVSVRLEYMRLLVFPARLPLRSFPAGALRGKRVTLRWVRE